ncbi:hypothetical protein ACX80Z_14360 [Arthrobacter sp. TMT4-20]
MTNILTLADRQVPGTTLKKRYLVFGTVKKTVEMHFDFFIDGKSLRTWIQEWEGADRPPEEVSLLTPAKPKLALEQIDRLLGLRPHQYWNRAWLLFCQACWDEGCGGVTVDIHRENGRVTWSGIGWDDSITPDTYRIENARTFEFDEKHYDQVFLEVRNRFTRG